MTASMFGAVVVWGLTRMPMVPRAWRVWDWSGSSSFAIGGEEKVGVEVEAALGDDVGLKGADGAGGGVARVGLGG